MLSVFLRQSLRTTEGTVKIERKDKMKKVISLLMSVVMLLSVMTGTMISANAADLTSGSCGSGVIYSFDKATGKLTISGSGAMTDYRKKSLSIFSGRKEIKSVVIGSGVTSVGDNTFYDCTDIASVSFPSSLKNIGENAFWYCISLNDIKIPSKVKHIGYNAFTYTGYYNTFSNWKLGVLYIGDCLVATNDALEGNYTVKSGTRLIAKNAFLGQQDLTGIKFPETITYIDYGTFSDCTDLVNLTLTGKITSIGESAFFNCKSLKKLTVKNGTKKIGKYAFNCCDSLTTISLPKSLTKIDFAAFYPCAKLKNVYYPLTKAKFDKIKIAKSNGPLLRAALHFSDDVKSLKLKAAKKGFSASWAKVKGAKSYEVKYSLNKNLSKSKTVKVKKNSAKIKKLKAKKKYYVQVRAVNGKAKSQWTKVKTIKTK